MSRASFWVFVACVLVYPRRVDTPPEIPPMKFPVSDSFNLDEDQESVAKQIERRMREHGFSDNLIAGALVNAYAESNLDASAVGREGEIGIFQLNPRGLGKNMKPHEMRDIRTSVDRIARAVRKNKKMMRLESKNATVEEHVSTFCVEIERPKNKREKAKNRVALMKKILID